MIAFFLRERWCLLWSRKWIYKCYWKEFQTYIVKLMLLQQKTFRWPSYFRDFWTKWIWRHNLSLGSGELQCEYYYLGVLHPRCVSLIYYTKDSLHKTHTRFPGFTRFTCVNDPLSKLSLARDVKWNLFLNSGLRSNSFKVFVIKCLK